MTARGLYFPICKWVGGSGLVGSARVPGGLPNVGMADGDRMVIFLGILKVGARGSELSGGLGIEVPLTTPEGSLIIGPCHK